MTDSQPAYSTGHERLPTAAGNHRQRL